MGSAASHIFTLTDRLHID